MKIDAHNPWVESWEHSRYKNKKPEVQGLMLTTGGERVYKHIVSEQSPCVDLKTVFASGHKELARNVVSEQYCTKLLSERTIHAPLMGRVLGQPEGVSLCRSKY